MHGFTPDSQDLDFEAPFEMIVTRPGTVSGLVVSFDTGFFAKSDPPPPPPPAGSDADTDATTSDAAAAAAAAGSGENSDKGDANDDANLRPDGGERGRSDGEATATGTGAATATATATVASWFSTGPESRPTHWKQTLLWLKPSEKPEGLAKGDAVAGRLSLHRNEVNPRELGLTVTWTATQQSTGRTFGGTQKYSVC